MQLLPPPAVARREFVVPYTDRQTLRQKVLRVLTRPPERLDAIDLHVAALGSVVAYSPFFVEGAITHYTDRTVVLLSLCRVDDKVVVLIDKQVFDPTRSPTFIARKSSNRFWQRFEPRSLDDATQQSRPLGSGHVLVERVL